MSPIDPIAMLFSTDVSLGTLWRVKESVWKDQLPNFYVSKEETKMHPGLSILKCNGQRNVEIVPLLHGTSSPPRGPIVVKGFSSADEKYGEHHKCSFGKILCPAQIPKKKMEEFDRTTSVFNSELAPIWYEEFEIIPNRNKPRVSKKEQEQLDLFLSKKMAEDG